MQAGPDTTLPLSSGLIQGLQGGYRDEPLKTTVAALTLAVSVAGSIAAGPFEDAATAYKKGNYATALELIRPLAERETLRRNLISGSCTSSATVSRRTMRPR